MTCEQEMDRRKHLERPRGFLTVSTVSGPLLTTCVYIRPMHSVFCPFQLLSTETPLASGSVGYEQAEK